MAQNKRISLPQAYPRNVRQALDGLQQAAPGQIIALEWLAARQITQTEVVLSMLKWLGLIDQAGRIDERLSACRGDDRAFAVAVRQRAIAAYSKGGCGGVQQWLGQIDLSRGRIRDKLRDMPHGPFAKVSAKVGGHKNAFYCLYTLHDWILKKTPEPTPPGEPARLRAAPPARPAAAAVTQARVADREAGHDFVRQQLLDDRPASPTASDNYFRVPFTFTPGGEPVWARIYVEGPLRPEYVARINHMLQTAMEDLQSKTS